MIDVGGGFRAIYGAGVMDRMLEDGIHVDHCYGVSAGSANMVSYISGQHGRNHTFYTQYAFRKEYASFDSYVKNHNYANLDYVYSTLSNHDGENPVDYEAFAANPTEFTVVACNADDGSTKYFDKSDVGYDNYDIMKASSAVPVACEPYVIDGVPYYDGGIADPIPVQKAIDAAKAAGADYVIGLGHLGIDEQSSPWMSKEVIANTTGFDAFIDGHSHTVMENKQVYDAAGKAVTLTQTGSYLANVGKMTIAEDGAITTELISTADVSDAAVAATAEAWINDVDAMLGEQIATTDIKFYINDPATGKRRIRMGETNLGDFVADGIYTYFNEVEQLDCDIAMMNGGGIRTDVSAGDWSFKTCKQISPFGNVACLMAVTGQQIQDALEFGARFVGPEGKENGGFLHVAGATYEIHTDIPNTVPTDDKNVWQGSATGTPRVQNVRIYDRKTGTYEPLDPNRTYALAGMNYTLRNLGDGFAMFDGAELIKDYVAEDYLVMSTYAMIFDGATEGMPVLASANSPLASYPGYLLDYEDPHGAGRIQVV